MFLFSCSTDQLAINEVEDYQSEGLPLEPASRGFRPDAISEEEEETSPALQEGNGESEGNGEGEGDAPFVKPSVVGGGSLK